MRKICFLIVLLLFSVIFSVTALADNIVISPIDSRPVSNIYFENLISLNNDKLYTIPVEELDIFTPDTERFANSAAVREITRKNVSLNPSENTTVIINASTYFTGGLIGSRCAEQYSKTDEALKELLSLIKEYPKPKYYINIAMPRNLPETRGQKIWADNNKIKGIGAFYIECNPNCEDYDNILKMSYVTPSQFLMEYGYVYNKLAEGQPLTEWENKFIEFCRKNYENNLEYNYYIQNYITPFKQTAKICERLIMWQKSKNLDEIVIGNDDLQLPAIISYFFSKGENWLPLENGTPIKYSFSRTYMNNIIKSMNTFFSKQETNAALEGKGDKINFIFGMDEIPQLIYARSLAQKNGYHANIDIKNYKNNFVAADYDVMTSDKLAQNALNFVSANTDKKGDKFNMFIFDYSVCSKDDKNNLILALSDSLKQNETGIIELYDYKTIKNADNFVFRELLENSASKNGKIGITELSCFCAWNTNANAIGIGIANAAVYSIAKNNTKDFVSFAEKHANILSQHILDDGIYYGGIREKLTAENYKPQKTEIQQSEKLIKNIETQKVIDAFVGNRFLINQKTALITDFKITKAAFPWQRLFDCDIRTECCAVELITN